MFWLRKYKIQKHCRVFDIFVSNFGPNLSFNSNSKLVVKKKRCGYPTYILKICLGAVQKDYRVFRIFRPSASPDFSYIFTIVCPVSMNLPHPQSLEVFYEQPLTSHVCQFVTLRFIQWFVITFKNYLVWENFENSNIAKIDRMPR